MEDKWSPNIIPAALLPEEGSVDVFLPSLEYLHPGGANGKESTYQCRKLKRCGRCGFSPWVGKIPWRRKWQPFPVFLPGESHGQRSLAGHSPWGRKESDTTAVTVSNGSSHQYVGGASLSGSLLSGSGNAAGIKTKSLLS